MAVQDLGRLDGKVAIVTGASRGIGQAIAVKFAEEGAHVIAAARNAADLADTVAQGDGRIVGQQCDVQHADAVKALVDRATNDFGALDVMVNNAGVALQDLLVDTTEADWDTTMNTNVKGTFWGVKFAIPAMKAGGSIINLGSITSFAGEQTSSAYVTSKGAVLMLTKNAAAETARLGIRVNIICPGPVDTPMARVYFEATTGSAERTEEITRMYAPLTGLIPTDDIARAALFLATEESRSMTGSSLLIDGGLLASWDHIES
ncbi:glucose 1-dehydrogenase [Mycobacterium yunnanensis]|uniref:Glucose 1-dehydrogenase n=1 Tax=Mycobacterium yunnanensis TaxID=368477 RepID=A0A9X3C5V5_9MYCO|nr:glucose 1-dehydrogenase [Mycobacterium yunnanensis]MCV7424732.1 glucose 1-dehydrogenase [Mycobacterium yunnanensis]